MSAASGSPVRIHGDDQRPGPAPRADVERHVGARDVDPDVDVGDVGTEQEDQGEAEDVQRGEDEERRRALERDGDDRAALRGAVRAGRDAADHAEGGRADEQAQVGRHAAADDRRDRVLRRLPRAAEVEVQEAPAEVVAELDRDRARVAGEPRRPQGAHRQPRQGRDAHDHGDDPRDATRRPSQPPGHPSDAATSACRPGPARARTSAWTHPDRPERGRRRRARAGGMGQRS